MGIPRPWIAVIVLVVATLLAGTALLVAAPGVLAPVASPTPRVSPAGELAAASPGTPGESPGAAPSLTCGPSSLVVARPSPSAGASAPLSPRPSAPPGFSLRVPILMYHRIVPPAEAGNSLPSLVVPPEVFAAQMAALDAAGWRTVTAAQLAADLAAGRVPAAHTFVVTFDDGYDDGYRYALPVLQAHHFVATYYIVPGRIGNPIVLTADHVRALTAAGMEIGDHTMNHVDLPHLTGAALSYQVAGAADRIAALTGQLPTTFAYPFGAEDPAVVRLVASCAFQLAVTNVEGVGETWAGRFLVPRLRVGPGTTPDQLVRLLAPYQ